MQGRDGRGKGGFTRATSMLFSVLADESDEKKAQEVLDRATQQVRTGATNAGAKPAINAGLTDSCSEIPEDQAKQQAADAGARAISADQPCATAPGAGAANALAMERTQSTPLQLEQQAADMLQEDREALATQLQHYTPEIILQELLGNLFVHPSQLKMEDQVGEGAFAIVNRASLTSRSSAATPGGTGGGLVLTVAVKRLKPEVLSSPSDLKDFLMEVNIMRKLRHPHIVSIHGIGATGLESLEAVRRSVYVVQEMLEGGNLKMMVLRQMTSRGSSVYEARDAIRWAIHIASAMHYLHSVCRPMIIHRDMKLENVLLTDGPMDRRVAKLADFGLHKRARLNAATGTLTAPVGISVVVVGPQGGPAGKGGAAADYEKSYYGGNLYYNAAGGNPSVHIGAGGSVHYGNASHHHNNAGGGGSVHFPGLLLSSNPSVHGSVHFPNQDASTHGQQRGSTAGGSLRNGNAAGAALQGAGGSLKNGTAAGAALQGTGGSLKNGSAAGAALQGTGGSLRNGSAAGAAVGALSRASSKSLGVPSVAGAYSEGNLAAAAGGDVASSENALAAAAAGEAHASVGGAAGPSLRSLVAVAAAAAAAEQAGGRMPKVGSTASLLALANPGGGDSVHGGSSYGGPSAGPSAHGGAAAIGALAAAGYTTSHLKPPLPPSAASGMQRQSSEVGAGLAAPVDPAAITLARASSASSTSFTAGSAAGGAAPFCLLATGSQRGMPPPPPVALPPGMTTLLLDPAQRHNLQNLNQLLGGQEGAEHAGAPSGGAARSLGGSRKGAKAGDALSGGDASVHRKMLALMALDQAAFASATEMCELPPDDTLPAVAAGSGPGGAGASSGAAAPFRTFQPPSHNNPQQALLLSEKCTLTDSCPMPPKPPALGASAAAAGGASQDAAGDGAGSQAVTPDASVSVTSPFASGPANASMGGAGAARSGGGAGGAGGGGGFGKGMGTIHEDKRLSTDLPPGQRPVFSSSLSGLPEGGAGAGAAAAAATGGSIRGGSAFAAAAVGQGTGGAGAAGTGSGRGSHKGSVRGSGKGQAAGLSAGAGAADLKKGAHFVDATQQVGSLIYMSPELLRGHTYNEKVDVFSFGIMLYELFAGRLLACKAEFSAGGEEAVTAYVEARTHGARERIPSRWPAELKAIVEECWAQEPEDRPDFGHVVHRLKQIQASGVLNTYELRAASAGAGCCTLM